MTREIRDFPKALRLLLPSSTADAHRRLAPRDHESKGRQQTVQTVRRRSHLARFATPALNHEVGSQSFSKLSSLADRGSLIDAARWPSRRTW